MNRFRDPPYPLRRIALCCLLLLAAGCSALRRPAPVVDLSQDARIREEVTARITAEPSLQPEPVRVEVEGGVVRLYGTVLGIDAWECAIRTAQLVAGVRTVVDYLVIQRGPRDITCLAPRETPTGGP